MIPDTHQGVLRTRTRNVDGVVHAAAVFSIIGPQQAGMQWQWRLLLDAKA